MLDFGYDVTNYRDVDPMFGTLADFDALVQRAHALGIRWSSTRVLESYVGHPSLVPARAGPRGAIPDQLVCLGRCQPIDLRRFGQEWDGEMQYYMHNFLTSQPDLNFHEPEVQDELLEVARYQLDRGVDGSGSTRSTSISATRKLRDNPALWRRSGGFLDRARRSIPLTTGRTSLRQEPAGNDWLSGAAAGADGGISGDRRGRRGLATLQRHGDHGEYTAAITGCRCAMPSSSCRRGADRGADWVSLNRFAEVAADGWPAGPSRTDVERHVTLGPE